MITEDIVAINVSKSAGSGSMLKMSLFPRNIPDARFPGRRNRQFGYMDVLAPNDWIYIFVDPQDGLDPDPIFFGFVDRVGWNESLDQQGRRVRSINVAATGWEKAVQNTQVMSNPWLSTAVSIPTLLSILNTGSEDDAQRQWRSEISNIIPELFRVFLTAESEDPTDSEAIETTVDAVNSVIERFATGGDAVRGIQPLMGQFEGPNTGIPLWNYVKLVFEELDQSVFVEPSLLLNSANKSLINLVEMFSNPLLNSAIYDVRRISDDGLSDIKSRIVEEVTGGYSSENVQALIDAASAANSTYGNLVSDVAPYFILRLRPLMLEELFILDGPFIDETHLTSIDLGVSDADLHNLTVITAPSVTLQMSRNVGEFQGFARYRNEIVDNIRRHGLKLYEDQSSAWPSQYSAPHASPTLMAEWEERLTRAGLDNVLLWNGSASIPVYLRKCWLGGSIRIAHRRKPGLQETPYNRVYYVDGLDYTYDAATGRFVTGFALTRGHAFGDTTYAPTSFEDAGSL
jgi:hypothetical protein